MTGLNGDGHQDLVFGCNGTLQAYLGHGDGTFSETPIASPVGDHTSLAWLLLTSIVTVNAALPHLIWAIFNSRADPPISFQER